MLLELRIANYKCFRDEQIFSLVASSDKSHPENLAEVKGPKKWRILKSAVVYGANASGKTTLLDALYFVHNFVRTSANKEPDERINVTPFLLDDESAKSPSSFEITFLHEDGVTYQYGFELDRTRVYKEWLTSFPKGRPRRLFRRFVESDGKESYDFGSFLKGEKEKLRELTRSNALFLSVGATFNNPQLLSTYRWVSDHLQGIQADQIGNRLFLPAEGQKGLFRQVRELLRHADLGIVDFKISERDLDLEKLSRDLPDQVQIALGKFLADLLESDSESNNHSKLIEISVFHQASSGEVAFDVDDESAGTRQLFALSFFILAALKQDGVLFIDELDSSLHPLLVQALVQLFHNPSTNPKNAQLVFNTHDTTLLSASMFRRDQIWLVEKDTDGAAHIYSLLEYSPRKSEALEKGYLQGRYGAIPFLGEPIAGVIADA